MQGTRRSGPVSLRLGVAGDDFGYAVDFGLPTPVPETLTAFGLDPEIKRECTWSGPVLRPAAMLTDRRGGIVGIRDDDGSWLTMHDAVRSYDSMLSLAAAVQTIREIGDVGALEAAIDHAFPGSSVEVTSRAGRFDLLLHRHGLLRPLASSSSLPPCTRRSLS